MWIQLHLLLNVSVLPSNKNTFASFGTQLNFLVRRQWVMYWRSPTYNLSRIVLMIALSLIFGSLYSTSNIATSVDIMAQLVLIFMGVAFICVCTMSTSIPFTYKNRGPLFIVNGWYWFDGLNSASVAWLWFWLISCISMAMWTYIGHFLAFAFPTMHLAVALAGGLTALLFVFSGFMINANSLKAWKWVYAINSFHYTLESMITTQYHNDTRLISVIQTFPSAKVSIKQFVLDYFANSFSNNNRISDCFVPYFIHSLHNSSSYLALFDQTMSYNP
ncbi:hypothetical protein THRCLA_06508 [Thraustotheca clavata]|uniref:ABC-2 type transporter transmembrane domain-containing protein n=1 Tax=Thraustotheca clavata TaxID=74557 RepID=A0A1V9ZNB5_9STRA|nr:hypothetical protein THRCLA_06508 [Thraustotheca clavata]